jgi:DNA-binding SARP family transcriptional activator
VRWCAGSPQDGQTLSKIRVRLLGGFEVWSEDRQVAGFESQKVRALLAYLICHRRRSFSREHLAELLWPDRNPETARHALRQAIYNLRTTLPADGARPLLSNHLEIGWNPAADCWLDVEAFEEAQLRGMERVSVDLQHLSTAAQLYRGELLAGFFVKDSPGFEDWMVTEQARLRETALEALRRLVESYRRRGEYRFALHYARRLVAVEPLSEEAHRELIRLFALLGQRNRALAQYEELVSRLRDDLGVEPLAETRVLHESILAEAVEAAEAPEEPVGPLVPLVGRQQAFGVLREGWLRALEGAVHFTLIVGEAGVGKTRLVKSFLDTVTSRRRTIVLKGRCYDRAPLVAYQPFLEAFQSAVNEETEATEQALRALPAEVRADLIRLVPELRSLDPDAPEPGRLEGAEGRRRLFASVGLFLEALAEGPEDNRGHDPLVLFLDDLDLADGDTFSLLQFLALRMNRGPIWIVAACRSEGLDRDHPVDQIVRRGEKVGTASRLELDRLGSAELEEVAESLVGEAQARELARFLEERSAGLPLAVTEVVNHLWDEGTLKPAAAAWSFASPLPSGVGGVGVEDLIRLRVRRLPSSTRRLASAAAIMGHCFDVEVLQIAEDEHIGVVEIGLEILLKRWLVRPFARFWASDQRERDLALWARGLRRGSFEFAHPEIRSALYSELNPLRRQVLHAQAADALERLRGDHAQDEALAHHLIAAGLWERALRPLERAVERARAVFATDTVERYCDRLVEVLSRLVASSRNGAQAERWRQERERVEELRDRVV